MRYCVDKKANYNEIRSTLRDLEDIIANVNTEIKWWSIEGKRGIRGIRGYVVEEDATNFECLKILHDLKHKLDDLEYLIAIGDDGVDKMGKEIFEIAKKAGGVV